MDYREILAGLIILLYLSDCLRLLEPDEVALASRGGGNWRVRFASERWQFARKDSLLANPFDPAECLFIVRWRTTAPALPPPGAAAAERLTSAARALAGPGRLCWVSWILALVVLPALLVLQAGSNLIIACAAALYLNIALAGLWIYRRRDRIGLPRATLGKAWAECVLCAPYGANLARKVALLADTRDIDLAQAAARLLDDKQMARVRGECAARLAELMSEYDAGTPEHETLKAEEANWRTGT